MKKLVIAGMFMFVVLANALAGEFNYASYVPATFQNITAQEANQAYAHNESKTDEIFVQIECNLSKYRVQCNYSNSLKRVPEIKKNVILMWMEMLGIDSTLSSLYQREILVTEGVKEYWVPIQEQLTPYMNQELVYDDTIELFIILIGKIESEFVFIATEFDKPMTSFESLLEQTVRTPSGPLISDR